MAAGCRPSALAVAFGWPHRTRITDVIHIEGCASCQTTRTTTPDPVAPYRGIPQLSDGETLTGARDGQGRSQAHGFC